MARGGDDLIIPYTTHAYNILSNQKEVSFVTPLLEVGLLYAYQTLILPYTLTRLYWSTITSLRGFSGTIHLVRKKNASFRNCSVITKKKTKRRLQYDWRTFFILFFYFSVTFLGCFSLSFSKLIIYNVCYGN